MRHCICSAVLMVLLWAGTVPAQAQQEEAQEPSSASAAPTVSSPAHRPAFLVGVDTGGVVAAGDCRPPYACPAVCDCVNGIAACYYGTGTCKVGPCGITGCYPVEESAVPLRSLDS
jgi:hypothetical protein